VVHALRARLPIVVELDGLDGRKRRRMLDFLIGVAYGLDARVSPVSATPHAYLLQPSRRGRDDRGREPQRCPEGSDTAETRQPESGEIGSRSALCVLCDLRPADTAFRSPLDMVIRRDGSRIVSPPAHVCNHCTAMMRHWRFMVAWCPECERWGRKGVRSPCGMPYG
jgi:hypothetical protein